MTAGTMPAPVAVWDARGKNNVWRRHTGEAAAWAGASLPAPSCCYRAGFCLTGAPSAVLYRYDRNDDGRIYPGPATSRPAEAEPVTVMLSELPPAHLRG